MHGNLVRQSEGTIALWPLLQLAPPLHAALASPLSLSFGRRRARNFRGNLWRRKTLIECSSGTSAARLARLPLYSLTHSLLQISSGGKSQAALQVTRVALNLSIFFKYGHLLKSDRKCRQPTYEGPSPFSRVNNWG